MADEQQKHIDYLNSVVRDELIKASVAMYNAKPANKHQFLADYFAKLSAEKEGGAAPAEVKADGGKQNKKEKPQKEKPQKGGKPAQEEKKDAAPAPAKAPAAKKVKMALSDVVIEVTPDTEIDPFDWEEVKNGIGDILIDGVLWAQSFGLQDFVFGLKKLIVICQIMDAKVPSTSVIVEAMKQIRGVGGAEMVQIECAAVDWEAEKTGRKGTKRPKLSAEQEAEQKAAADAQAGAGKGKKGGKQDGGKKGGAQDGGKKGGDGGKKKGGKEEPQARLVTKQMIDKDAKKIQEAAKDATFFVASVPEMDGSAQTDVSIENLQECLKQVRSKLPAVGLMLVAAGSTKVTILANLPADKSATVSALDWVNSTGVAGSKGGANEASVEYVCNPNNDEFPIKLKDGLTAAAFTFLKKAGALDDGSEDEFYDAPDAGGY